MPSTSIEVEGNGAVAEMYRRLGESFRPPDAGLGLDLGPCLPRPSEPDIRTYMQIGMLLGTSWLLAVTEPYGLRLRHWVMCYYHPDRAKQRASWLHNHILQSRGNFIQFARKQLKKPGKEREPIGSLWQRLVHRNAILVHFFGGRKTCTVCASPLGSDLGPCSTPGCRALFCPPCVQFTRYCPVCRSPIESGYPTDFSEERDSSEEELNWDEESCEPDTQTQDEPTEGLSSSPISSTPREQYTELEDTQTTEWEDGRYIDWDEEEEGWEDEVSNSQRNRKKENKWIKNMGRIRSMIPTKIENVLFREKDSRQEADGEGWDDEEGISSSARRRKMDNTWIRNMGRIRNMVPKHILFREKDNRQEAEGWEDEEQVSNSARNRKIESKWMRNMGRIRNIVPTNILFREKDSRQETDGEGWEDEEQVSNSAQNRKIESKWMRNMGRIRNIVPTNILFREKDSRQETDEEGWEDEEQVSNSARNRKIESKWMRNMGRIRNIVPTNILFREKDSRQEADGEGWDEEGVAPVHGIGR